MKVAKKSPGKPSVALRRATLTLSMEIYRKIDALRGDTPRSVWVQTLIEREEARRERERFAIVLREQYTEDVCRQTLAIDEEYPIHET